MAKKSKPFDAARYLDSDEAIAAYITEALRTYDLQLVTHAIGVAAKAKGMTKIAEKTGLSRESLYKALSADGNPNFDTILRVVTALGLQLGAEPVSPNKSAPRKRRSRLAPCVARKTPSTLFCRSGTRVSSPLR